MLLVAIAAIAVTSLGSSKGPIVCPVMGTTIKSGTRFTDYNGVRFRYCCNDCKAKFEKNPKYYLEKAVKEGKIVGQFIFDPITRKPIKRVDAVATSDYEGVRFFFSSKNHKSKFDKSPKTYGALPTKECLYCPVGKERVRSYAKATGYADYKGVRYYLCCYGCDEEFSQDQENLAKAATKYVMKPGVHN